MQRQGGEDYFKMIKESSLPSAFGTPNDVRLFPGTSNSVPNTSSTRSIPIANNERSLVEIQQDEEEALAEYRDHAMYLRIVHGMKEKRMGASTSQITLQDCVSDTVAKIARTRNSQLVQDNSSGHYGFKETRSVNDVSFGYQNVLQKTDAVCWGDPEEEGIFEMDM
mmetsp:Transcript_9187/g.17527  ORF Transcript_9187/g.17527 Transcript_9187/m.17527 type:complete len:166 (-) Transcript_9187:251-748(-)|eukprot:scaffold45607_cov237-Amphora_coffeaeformis.AAC.16